MIFVKYWPFMLLSFFTELMLVFITRKMGWKLMLAIEYGAMAAFAVVSYATTRDPYIMQTSLLFWYLGFFLARMIRNRSLRVHQKSHSDTQEYKVPNQPH